MAVATRACPRAGQEGEGSRSKPSSQSGIGILGAVLCSPSGFRNENSASRVFLSSSGLLDLVACQRRPVWVSGKRERYFFRKVGNRLNVNMGEAGFPGGSVVKNPHAVQETRIQSLGGDDPEQETAVHSSILYLGNSTRGASWATVHGSQKRQIRLSAKQQQSGGIGLKANLVMLSKLV